MSEEQEKQEEVKDEVVSQEEAQSEEIQEEVVDDRPEKNYRAELERKTRELEKLRHELDSRNTQPAKRDQNDISTWPDHELKALMKSADPNLSTYKEQAEDILLERKVSRLREKERMEDKRLQSELELRSKYPEALNPSSELSLKMEEVMQMFDLQKSPAGRLAAAKIAASELGSGHSKSDAKARKAEADRVARVKSNMVDGDRAPAPRGKNPEKESKDLNARLMKGDEGAVGDAMRSKGIFERFNKKWNG